jgi:hypothetical protein
MSLAFGHEWKGDDWTIDAVASVRSMLNETILPPELGDIVLQYACWSLVPDRHILALVNLDKHDGSVVIYFSAHIKVSDPQGSISAGLMLADGSCCVSVAGRNAQEVYISCILLSTIGDVRIWIKTSETTNLSEFIALVSYRAES